MSNKEYIVLLKMPNGTYEAMSYYDDEDFSKEIAIFDTKIKAEQYVNSYWATQHFPWWIVELEQD